MKYILILGILFSIFFVNAQKEDSLMLRKIFTEALEKGKSHEDLRSLCKDIGARLSGSPQAAMAVEWAENKCKEYGFSNIRLQEIKVPHWERGTKEVAWYKTKGGDVIPLNILALGGSIATNGLLQAQIVEFKSFEDLKKASLKDVKGKIVFLNQAMKASEITTFSAYGGCYSIRTDGAVEAAKLGAVGILIRSLAMPQDNFPHTGTLHYDSAVAKIPAAALSTNDCNLLSEVLENGPIEVLFELNCVDYQDATSYNVIAEIEGSKFPDQIITIGGHLDSWDAGEGAHDDGAGIIHCLEAIRLMKILKIVPKHTVRIVFYMNEENGNRGGIAYASESKKENEKQIAAIESDRGGFSPRGFDCDGTKEQIVKMQKFSALFKPYGLSQFEKGYGGVDIGPLKKQFDGIPLFGFVPDSQRYFDFHHAESDVFENVNKRELELGCASMASFVYLLDNYYF